MKKGRAMIIAETLKFIDFSLKRYLSEEASQYNYDEAIKGGKVIFPSWRKMNVAFVVSFGFAWSPIAISGITKRSERRFIKQFTKAFEIWKDK